MDKSLAAVFPGGVPFVRPTEGRVVDWTPDSNYSPLPHQSDDIGSDHKNASAVPLPSPAADHAPKSTATVSPKSPALNITDRDLEMFRFLARHRMASYDQLARAFGTTTNALRQRLPRLRAAGFLQTEMRGAPAFAVWMPTSDAIKASGLDVPVPSFSSTYEHNLGLTDLALDFTEKGAVVLTETEIRASDNGRKGLTRFASPTYAGTSHRPDIVVFRNAGVSGRPWCIALELELNRKDPEDLRRILNAYRRAHHIDEVLYYTPQRAIAEALARVAKEVGVAHKLKIRKFVPSVRSTRRAAP